MDPAQQPTTTLLQPVPTPSSKSSKKLALIIFIITVVLLVLLSGGVYYYLEILRPAQYAKEVVPIVSEIGKQVIQSFPNINQKDYKDTLYTLVKRQGILDEARNQLSKFRPVPRKMQQFNEDIRWGLEYFLAANTEAQEKAAFLADLLEIYLIFKPEKLPFDTNTAYVRDYQKYYEDQILRAKNLGNQIFGREEVSLERVTFDQLKNSWQEIEGGLDLILENILAQDPNKPLSDYASLPPTNEQQGAIDKLRDFGRLSDEAFSKNTTSDILSYRHYTGISKEELEERSQRIEATSEELKKRYSIHIPIHIP